MISGNDTVIPAVGDPAALEACLRIIQRHWPHAKFEDAETGEKYERHPEIPLGRVRELLVYPDDKAEAAWDADTPDSPQNSMLYLILSPTNVTVVLDDPSTVEMRVLLDSIRSMLRQEIVKTYARAA
jgi:hypothetical protein